MKLIQGQPGQCTLYAAAMVLDVDPLIITSFLGHDGMEIIWPMARGWGRHRGIDMQEIQDFSIQILGVGFVTIYADPQYGLRRKWLDGTQPDPEPIAVYGPIICAKRLQTYFSHYSGVIISDSHAVAYDHVTQRILDPEGRAYSVSKLEIPVLSFHVPVGMSMPE